MAAKDRTKIPILPPRWRLALYLALTLILLATGSKRAGAMLENHFLYFPERTLVATPATFRLSYKEISFPAEDGTMLHGWFIPGEPDRPVVLFCHGNAGNISHRVDNLYWLNQAGYSTFIFDYRGYGRSAGNPSEPGLYADARGALAWLKKEYGATGPVIYFGRSLGAAIALQLAIETPPQALIMESAFTSVTAMGKTHYPLLYHLLGWLIAAEYDNEEKIGRLRAPLLLIHGTGDAIVPVAMGRRLYDLAPSPRQLYLVEGADHNDGHYLEGPKYWIAWQSFLAQLD